MRLKLFFGFVIAVLVAMVAVSPVTGQFNSPISPLPTPTHEARPDPPWMRTPEPTPIPIGVVLPTVTPMPTATPIMQSEPTPDPIVTTLPPRPKRIGFNKPQEQMEKIKGTK